MEQNALEPTAQDLRRVKAQRAWVRDHYQPEVRHRYESINGKLEVVPQEIA
jgi:hypothetical protein